MARLLVFVPTYNERETISRLIDEIATAVPSADILIVDDNSPDGTWEILQETRKSLRQLNAVRRPRKLGIGSAHKYAMIYAMREGYDVLATLDADFSHPPSALPSLIALSGPNTFVIGSRYCSGGTSDYRGYRAWFRRPSSRSIQNPAAAASIQRPRSHPLSTEPTKAS